MSTIEASKTHPADEQVHSESELAIIGDMTVWYQMPYLSARRIIQLNSKRWPIWDRGYITRIAEARRLDDSRDWYFPIIVKKSPWNQVQQTSTDNFPSTISSSNPLSWSWSGIWHSTAHHASERVHTLPPMTHLPYEWIHFSLPRCDIVASAGGLLLIKSIRDVPARRSPRLNPLLADNDRLSVSDTSTPTVGPKWPPANKSRHSINRPLNWTRLLVCNPLTKECRELPAANCQLMGWPSWLDIYFHGVQAHLVVNNEANCYQVILTLRDFVSVYKSTTNSWNSLRFPKMRPWGPYLGRWVFLVCYPWGYHGATVHVNGHLYFADVQSDPQADAGMAATSDPATAGTLRLFEVDTDAGRWHLLHEYSLRKFHLPILNPCPQFLRFNMGVLQYMELVGCMGDLYAVIPARLHDVVTVGQKQTCRWKFELHSIITAGMNQKSRWDFKFLDRDEMIKAIDDGLEYMPLVFHVMQLQEDGVVGVGVDHAVLRIPVPETRTGRDLQSRKDSLYEKTSPAHAWGDNWFSCHARGSVIWVSCEDYLLAYDVVSRESKTQILPLDDSVDQTLKFDYRPSFDMKP